LRWRWSDSPPHEGTVIRPSEPDRALFVVDSEATVGSLAIIAGLGLHETRAYVFLDDLTTNPQTLGRLRLSAVEHLLRAAQQYAVSVGKPICAFTAVPSLYRIAKRLGFASRPRGALLVFAAPTLPLKVKKRAAEYHSAARFTVDGENVRRERHHAQTKVPRQAGKHPAKLSNGKESARPR
jgi:hypothetical protein